MILALLAADIWTTISPHLPAIITGVIGAIGGLGISRYSKRFQRHDIFLERIESLTDKLSASYIDKLKAETAKAKADQLIISLEQELKELRTQLSNKPNNNVEPTSKENRSD